MSCSTSLDKSLLGDIVTQVTAVAIHAILLVYSTSASGDGEPEFATKSLQSLNSLNTPTNVNGYRLNARLLFGFFNDFSYLLKLCLNLLLKELIIRSLA